MRAPSRRRYRRMTLRVRVEYRIDDEARTDDATTLGAGGLFIATNAPADEGTPVWVCFSLSDRGQRHEFEGRVVWKHSPGDLPEQTCGMGISFTHPPTTPILAAELEALAQQET